MNFIRKYYFNDFTHIHYCFHLQFQCCGVDSYEDWKGHFNDSFALPVSCCKAVSGTTGAFYCNSHNRSSTTSTPFTEITTHINTETSSVATTVSPSSNVTAAPSASTSVSAATTTNETNGTAPIDLKCLLLGSFFFYLSRIFEILRLRSVISDFK